MTEKDNNLDYIIHSVKKGYEAAASYFANEIDPNRLELQPYKKFKEIIHDGQVLELGCGNGFPIAKDLLNEGYDYCGIDLSIEQINLCRTNNPNYRDKFLKANMIDYIKKQPNKKYSGILMLFSLFHIPKEYHLQILQEIYRILQPKGAVLFTSFDSDWEGQEDNWLESGRSMYWSNHKTSWYEEQIGKVGFKRVQTFMYETKFFESEEKQFYHLAIKPQ